MSPLRRQYELTDEQLSRLLDACKPTPVMYLSGGMPMGPSQQENANSAWAALGREMGFDPWSVRPVPGKSQAFFTAEPR